MESDAGVLTRKVFARRGLVTWRHVRVRVGAGLIGEHVAIEERDADETVIRYGFKQVRRLHASQRSA